MEQELSPLTALYSDSLRPVEEPQSPQRARRVVFVSTFLLLWWVVMSFFASADFAVAYAKRASVEIEPILSSERNAWRARNPSLMQNAMDQTSVSLWRDSRLEYFSEYVNWSGMPPPSFEESQVQSSLDGDLLRVTVLVTLLPVGGSTPTMFHELRYFRHVGDAWKRTDGHVLENVKGLTFRTSHFHVAAFDMDRTTAQRALAGLEDFYAQASRDFGAVDSPTPAGALPLELDPPPLAPLFGYPTDVTVSPGDEAIAVLRAPLANSIAHLAFEGGQDRLEEVHGANLQVLAEGLIAWEARTYAPMPSAWQAADKQLVRNALQDGSVIPLAGMTRRVLPVNGFAEAGPLVTYEAWSLADYIAATYGQGKFAQVIPAIAKYDQWDDLTRNVFGVSAAEFEAGWRKHLESLVASR